MIFFWLIFLYLFLYSILFYIILFFILVFFFAFFFSSSFILNSYFFFEKEKVKKKTMAVARQYNSFMPQKSLEEETVGRKLLDGNEHHALTISNDRYKYNFLVFFFSL